MKNKNPLLFLFFLCLSVHVFADIALPKTENLSETKYYFANVDSFSNYTFYLKKNTNDKMYRIKQKATFLLKDNDKIDEERLEVWAVKNDSKQKTNSFILKRVKPSLDHGGPVAHIAIQFYFDKKNNLNYKQTVMKPDCYKKKKFVPLFIDNNFPDKWFLLLLMSLMSIAFLRIVYAKRNTLLQNAYV